MSSRLLQSLQVDTNSSPVPPSVPSRTPRTSHMHSQLSQSASHESKNSATPAEGKLILIFCSFTHTVNDIMNAWGVCLSFLPFEGVFITSTQNHKNKSSHLPFKIPRFEPHRYKNPSFL